MQYRIINLFQWTTVAAIVLFFFVNITRAIPPGLRDVRHYLAAMAVWAVVLVPAYLSFRWLVRGRNDMWAIYGMCVGIAVGIAIALTTDVGYRLAEVFEPREAPHFNATQFGVAFGAVVGAFCGALIGGIAGIIKRHSGTPEGL
jgi:hypothetical protein